MSLLAWAVAFARGNARMSSNGTKIAPENTGRNTGRFAPGHDPRRGVGVKGRSGRKPDWLKEFCDDMLADPKCRGIVRKALHGEEIPATTIAMWKAAAERAHGKPSEQINVKGDIQIRVLREPRRLAGDD